MKQKKKKSPDLSEVVDQAVQEKLGHEQLRPGQEEAVTAVLEGRDTLAVMPTGAGKSAIYQIAGALIPGATVVVSPLIALQRDQVEAIAEENVGDAALVNSTLRAAEREEALDEFEEGATEFLFLAPEQLANEEMLARLQAVKPTLFVVDEAHCISEWGHDFRPEYLRLGAVVETLAHPRILALTATASPPVQQEIVERLGMREPQIIVRGFDRPNIRLAVEGFADEEEKREELVARVLDAPKPGIVYAATRRHTEELAAALCQQGVNAVAYHAGMAAGERARIQEAFMSDAVDVIVATTAFGMGVDKPNVRFVYHLDVSESVDAYYQEIGRAGRDGEPAEAILFFRREDLNLRRFFAASGQVDADQMERVAEVVQDADGSLAIAEISEEVDLSKTKVTVALSRLEEVGAVDVLPTGEVVATVEEDVAEAAEEAAEAQENLRKFARSRIEMMRAYADMRDCRREYILNYFGEGYAPPCGNCDNCEAGLVIATSSAAQPFPVKSRVEHKEWGSGMVMRYAGDTMVVLFDSVGYRTLAVDLVVAKDLLTPAA
ncbi:MAG: RecQ family ATP-dependent DNA helicase [Chloroflexi bacterium]|nr:RecQ family ATP-dependent DNA helicase [Chloroflexota bacterium]